MPRNKSERVPHPELPQKFHDRARLWEVWRASDLGSDYLAYQACCESFTNGESFAYSDLPNETHNDLKDYYKEALAKRDSDGA